MDVDPPTLATHSSTTQDVKHCETHEKGVNGVPRAISCTEDSDRHLSPSSTVAIDMGENSGTIKEDVSLGSNT